MIQVTEVAFSCYAVTDVPRARAFYEGILGLVATAVTDLLDATWIEYEFGPYALAIGRAPGWKPSPDGCTVGLEVADFDATIAHLKARGVPFRMEPFPTPVCRMAMISDPDGNTLCIHKRNPPAA